MPDAKTLYHKHTHTEYKKETEAKASVSSLHLMKICLNRD